MSIETPSLRVGISPTRKESLCMTDRVGQQFGNYQLLRLLGEGNFAEVYQAEHLYLETPAAIKILHTRMEPDSQESFLREARTIAHLQHPHIVRVLDFGIQDQTPYLVMEYTPNGTLRSLHPKGTRWPFEQIVSYVKQIASALDHAHKHRVIHRDVKPANILLNAKGEVILSDFGIAVMLDTQASLSERKMAGTPLYMAPEQIQHQPCAASDQYALGVIAYEWFCGEPPFHGPLVAVLSQHMHQAPPSLCARQSHLPPAVEDAVFGALAKDPSQRFATVQDFALVLEEACFATQHLPVHPSIETEPSKQPRTPPIQHYTPSTLSPVLPATIISQHPLPVSVVSVSAPPESMYQTLVASTLAQRYRQTLLRKVRTFWIEGVLNHSLHGAALLALGLQTQPDAVANPWHLVLQQPETTPRPLPNGTRITQVYDQAEQELLILGAPGAGKTTLLLELARDLLERAERNEQHPMPVVFNLSSWAMKQQPLNDWLGEELNNRYLVSPKFAQAFVEADQILPLLDGLDEVAAKERTACIEAINTYRLEHSLQPPVVCSRSADYLAQTERLRLGSAVMVQPLTPQQVTSYLSAAGPQLAALRAALQLDSDLQALATTPLMLNILTLAYQGTPLDQIAPLGTLPVKQQQVFATYVQRMLTHRSATTRYTPEQTLSWLSFLAQRMKRHNQTIFYIEHMQPDWLVDKRMLRKYDWLAVHLPYILVGVLVGLAPSLVFFYSNIWKPYLPEIILLSGLLGWLLGGESTAQQSLAGNGEKARGIPWYWLLQRLGLATLLGSSIGLISWKGNETLDALVAGLSFALCCFLLILLVRKSDTPQASVQRTPQRRPIRGKVMLNALLVGLLAGLSSASVPSPYPEFRIEVGLLSLLLGGLSSGILSVLLIEKYSGIQPTDRLVWTWQSFSRSLFSKHHVRSTLPITGIGLFLLSAILWLYGVGIATIATLGLLIGSFFGLCFWLLLSFFRGVKSATIDNQLRMASNQGIRHSGFNAFGYGLTVAILVGLGGIFATTWTVGPIIGLSVGLLAGLFHGGLACLRHYTLRVLLWRSGVLPWDYSHFLEAVTERILLRKVGGGYIFVHRLLLDYLSTLGTNELVEQRNAISSRPITPAALLPCGHGPYPNARFCGVCGAAVPS
jgi:serine/threonine protein kinase/DNA polymerase III delta prime subunit